MKWIKLIVNQGVIVEAIAGYGFLIIKNGDADMEWPRPQATVSGNPCTSAGLSPGRLWSRRSCRRLIVLPLQPLYYFAANSRVCASYLCFPRRTHLQTHVFTHTTTHITKETTLLVTHFRIRNWQNDRITQKSKKIKDSIKYISYLLILILTTYETQYVITFEKCCPI